MLRARGVATSSFIVTAASKSRRRLLWPLSSSSLRESRILSASTTIMRTSSQHNASTPPSYPVVPKHDFGPLKEYSVIHTDRSLNLMSSPFGTVMRDLNALLKHTYHAAQVAIIPGYVNNTWAVGLIRRPMMASCCLLLALFSTMCDSFSPHSFITTITTNIQFRYVRDGSRGPTIW
jgi:hypothetical protein